MHTHRRRAIRLHKVSRILNGEKKKKKKDFFDGWLWQGTTGESESEEEEEERGGPREVGDRWLC